MFTTIALVSVALAVSDSATVFVTVKDGVSDPHAAVARAEADLIKALKTANVALTDLDVVFPLPKQPNDALKLIQDGKDAFENLESDTATQRFQAALTFFQQHPAMADPKTLAEIHLFIANVASQGPQATSAQTKKKIEEDMHRAASLDPSRALDPKFFSPDLIAQWKKAIQDVAAKPKAKLTFTSMPLGAEVLLDGNPIGVTPIADPVTVTSGRHVIIYRRNGFFPTGVLYDAARPTAEVKIDLKAGAEYEGARQRMGDVLPGNFGGSSVPKAAQGVGDTLRTRYLVVAEVDAKGAGPLEVWDVQNLVRHKEITLVQGNYTAAAQSVKKIVGGSSSSSVAVVPTNNASAGSGKSKDDPSAGSATASADANVAATASNGEPIFKKWWFWAIVGGVVVAGAGTGIAVAASSGGGFSPVLANP